MLNYKGHIFAGDGAGCACCTLIDKVAVDDPTGTKGLRSKMRATMALRWRKLRVIAKQIIVDHDLLQIANGGLLPVKSPAVMGGASKVQSFQRWFDHALQAIVLGADGSVMRPMLAQGYADGRSFAEKQLKRAVLSNKAQHTQDTIFQLAVVELQGIIEAVSQQSVRAVANALLTNQKPMAIVRIVWDRIEKIGVERTGLMVDQLIVTAFNQAALDTYEASGIGAVGIVAEAKPPARVGDAISDAKRRTGPGARISRKAAPSARTIRRIRAAQRRVEALGKVNVVTAGDENVCVICEDIADAGPYKIDTARSLIPAHPRCRCAFVPVGDARFGDADVIDIIRKLPNGEFRLYSKTGKNLGTFATRAAAEKHEREVNYFKHRDAFDPNQPRDPGGEGGGQWIKGVGEDDGFKRNDDKPGVPADITNEEKAMAWLRKHGAGTEEEAEALFNKKIAELDPDFYHEVPGDAVASIKRNGIEGDYGIFASVNVESDYVSTPQKTIVKFKMPKSELRSGIASPDMPYSWHARIGPYQSYIISHFPSMSRGFVSLAVEGIGEERIKSVKLVGGI